MKLKILAFTIVAGFASPGEASVPRYGEYAFDSSVSNEFWCTWGWTAPAPAAAPSAAVATFDFSGTTCDSSASIAPFYRARRKSIAISFR
jgi:hypothetical protein